MDRRTVLAGGLTCIVAPAFADPTNLSGLHTEEQKGDEVLTYESIEIDPQKIGTLVHPNSRATFEPRVKDFGEKLVAAAAMFVGKSRADTPDDVTEMLGLFMLPFRYKNGQLVPYCAAGLAFAAASAYTQDRKKEINKFNRTSVLRQSLDELDHWYFYPSPSVWSMYFVSRGKGTWKDATGQGKPIPRPGWIVLYDFGKGADHCGIVESATKDELNTIEFNTTSKNGSEVNGGVVARKTRDYNSRIKGFIPIV